MSEIELKRNSQAANKEDHMIASRLFKARTKLGIERGELALHAGITEKELADYENAVEEIPASTLLYISKVMGVSFDYFFDDSIEIYDIDVSSYSDEVALLN